MNYLKNSTWKRLLLVAICCTILPLAACTKPQRGGRSGGADNADTNSTDTAIADEAGVEDVQPSDSNASIGEIDVPNGGSDSETNNNDS